mmetsp:Transcript_7710/g.16028  ORF Transcript_7710/g.16028 Transcript_7710/m.16028 type:complete len:161 (+) Transcript_7710:617-1099(+)
MDVVLCRPSSTGGDDAGESDAGTVDPAERTHALPFASPAAALVEYILACGPACVISDTCPLRHHVSTVAAVASVLNVLRVPLYQVDAHNIVPVWAASDKREVGARTLRPRINRVLQEYLVHIPIIRNVLGDSQKEKMTPGIDWDACVRHCSPDAAVPTVP